MNNNTLVIGKINPFPLAMTAGMLVDMDAPEDVYKPFMDQVISQCQSQGVDIRTLVKDGDSNSYEPITFSVPSGVLLTVAENIQKAVATQPQGAVALMKAWLPFIVQVIDGHTKDTEDDIHINRGGLEYGTN